MDNVMNIYGDIAERPAPGRSTTAEMVVSRQAQEVQAAMVIAKKFPRNEVESFNRIMQACKRITLAEQSMYEYQRGDTKVTGPSIRLAETAAQNWGNIDFGIIELEQKPGESQVMAYAWDLETNTRQTKIFSVPHVRETKKGNFPLTKPRDIYELVANNGARRLRACILGVIPGDVIEAAVAQCNATLTGQCNGPLIDTIRKIAGTFEEKYGVTIPMLEKYIGCKVESFSMNDLIRLKKVYRALQDGMADREDYFDMMSESDGSEVVNPFKGEKEKPKKKTKLPDLPEAAGSEAGTPEPGKDAAEPLDPSFIPPESDPNLPFA